MFFLFLMQVLSIICFYQADKCCETGKKYRGWILISVIMLVIPASIRNESVGTDVSVYQKPLFLHALNSFNMVDFNAKTIVYDIEFLYKVLVFSVSKISKSIQILFLIQELWVLIPIYRGLWIIRKKFNIVIAFIAYVFLYYTESYNTIRQNIALSLLFLAVCFVIDCRFIECIFYEIVAIGFHKSAIVGFAVIFFYLFSKKMRNDFSLIYRVGIFLLVFLISSNYVKIFTYFVTHFSFLPVRYLGYQYLHTDDVNIPMVRTLLELFLLIVLLVKEQGAEQMNLKLYQWLSLLNLVTLGMLNMASSTVFAARILWYFMIFEILDISVGETLLKKNKINKNIYLFLSAAFLISYWIYVYLVLKACGIYPYQFYWK